MIKTRIYLVFSIISFLPISFCEAYSGGNGSVSNPYQISTPGDWQQLMTTAGDWSNYFALTADVNLAKISLTPVGNETTNFTGALDGNGHVISNAVINLPSSSRVGLFGYVGPTGQVKNLGIVNANITAMNDVGSLIGWNEGSVSNCYATGQVVGNGSIIGGLIGGNQSGSIDTCNASVSVSGTAWYVGGLVGNSNGSIISSYTTGSVTGSNNYVGGLVGSTGGSISTCYSTGPVTLTGADGWFVGGIAGENSGIMTLCYATGDIKGVSFYTGGLLGMNTGIATFCFATGAVDGNDSVGGLAGYSGSQLTYCYASGDVNGINRVGGLVGITNWGDVNSCLAEGTVRGTGGHIGGLIGMNDSGEVIYCCATGSVSGAEIVGGFVGNNSNGNITESYATGSVTGTESYSFVGGLIGTHGNGNVTSCYATGAVTGGNYSGGLLGYNHRGRINHCYSTGKPAGAANAGGLCAYKVTGGNYNDYGNFWDTQTSQTATSTMGTGKTTDEMKTKSTFTPTVWDFSTVWAICEGTNYPRLQWQIPVADWACPDGIDFKDYAVLAAAWQSNSGQPNWNPDCDISDLKDNIIDWKDMAVFADYWLESN